MNPASSESLPVGRLGGLGAKLGQGGQAVVYAAPALSLPDAPGPLVYKEYKPGQQPPQGLRRLVKARNDLDPAERARLDRRAIWPLRVVEDGSTVRGVVMHLIPPAFMQDRVLPGTGAATRSTRDVQNLLIPPDRARVVGMPVPTLDQRLALCRDLAAALHLLHRHKLVFGDLNAKNEVFSLHPDAAVMLVDCDAVRLAGSAAVVAQLNAPDWEAPERWLTVYTDRFKYGLFVLRCLSTGDQVSTTVDPGRADAALDHQGQIMLRAALGHIPNDRPTAQHWGRYFDHRLTGRAFVKTASTAVPEPRHEGWVRDPATGKMVRR
ncbi:hypothetical protein [Actinoplanes sp. NPDC089786]|uniref:hypothetical protein n=1 Tax=Actinoplanes sp. NPDC089786 TaxID=3155185 RepID=UPI00342A236A